ncbi:hypothetical protein VTI74DRAFT_7768 [Chaetomium olivicolor]
MFRYLSLHTFESSAFDLFGPQHSSVFPYNGEGVRTHPLPGVRCKTCLANGEEVWVVPGLVCAKCRTPAPDDGLLVHSCHGREDGQ